MGLSGARLRSGRIIAFSTSLKLLQSAQIYLQDALLSRRRRAGRHRTPRRSTCKNKQTSNAKAPLLTPEQFANLGEGMIAYVREMRSEDVNRLYPQAPHIEPGLTIFVLLGADGSPIVLADSEEGAIGNARENDLTMVSLH